MDTKTILMDEYKEVNNNMRHYSNMRIALLTITLALNGTVIKDINELRFNFTSFSLGIMGTLATCVFLIFENRVTAYYLFFQKRAKEIEIILEIKQYSREMISPKINATRATIFLYYSLILFWKIYTILLCLIN